MKASLQLRVSQHLTMTPQLQQAIRLLQLSSLELQMEVQDALESNMMLELDESDEIGTTSQEDNGTTDEIDSDVDQADNVSLNDASSIPEDLPVDSAWEDIYDSGINYSRNFNNFDQNLFENQDTNEKTLRDHLLWQLNVTSTSDTDKVIAISIIDALDDDGYLTCSLEDIHDSMGDDIEVGLDEVKAVLSLVQAMEPTGVAARDLQECLLLQLGQCAAETSWLDKAKELVSHHFNLLAIHDYNQIMRRMKLEQEKLQEVIALIQSMNPRPGSQIQETQTQYIVPDVYVKKDKGIWRVELNIDAIPQLRINSSYANMIRRADNSRDNVSLKTHLQEARWFIKSLHSRSETLLRVASSIVERQRAFLEHGEEAMKPLVLHDIAETLGMHESTISRVTTRKYMHTPRGIFELKYFFSSQLNTDHGGVCSSTAIRALIKKLIDAETPKKPLSDSKITAILSEQGIRVARRTIAKYREAMSIPPSNERKRLA
jgi:RNA polymerase sigma-54 factor